MAGDLIKHRIFLETTRDFGKRLPPTALGEILRVVEPTIEKAARMAFEGRGAGLGRKPKWLANVSDIRLRAVTIESSETVLDFDAPSLGYAAPELYKQTELWPSMPEPSLSAFDLVAGVVSKVSRQDRDSDWYDQTILDSIFQFSRGLNGTFSRMAISRSGDRRSSAKTIDKEVIARAKKLLDETPLPRPTRIVGTLDMVRASTQSFGLLLDNGEEVRGVMIDKNVVRLGSMLERKVLVHGRAVYRPSGKLLRIDAEKVEDGSGASQLWTRIPEPLERPVASSQARARGPKAGGLASFFGGWPGDESDEELLGALRELG